MLMPPAFMATISLSADILPKTSRDEVRRLTGVAKDSAVGTPQAKMRAIALQDAPIARRFVILKIRPIHITNVNIASVTTNAIRKLRTMYRSMIFTR